MSKYIFILLFCLPVFIYGQPYFLKYRGGEVDSILTRVDSVMVGVNQADMMLWDEDSTKWDVVSLVNFKDTIGVYNVTPEQFPAATDSSSFAQMFASNDSLRIYLEPDKVYDLDAVQLTYAGAKYITIEMNGATLDMGAANFITFTSGAEWTQATHTGFSSDLQAAARADTLFTTDFVKDSFWVGIVDVADWGDLEKNDLLGVQDSTTVGGGFFNGLLLVVDRLLIDEKRIYFNTAFQYTVDTDSTASNKLHTLRLANIAGKHFIMRNGFVKNGGIKVGGFETVLIENVVFELDSTTQANYLAIDMNHNLVTHTGMAFWWIKKLTVNDCFVDGYIQTGADGYGIVIGVINEVTIDNLTGKDCHHITTTGAFGSGGIGQNYINIKNSSARFTQRMVELRTGNFAAWDTHMGTYMMNIDNCVAYNDALTVGNHFVSLRGVHTSISNCKVYGFDRFLFVMSIGGEGTGRRITVTDNEIFDVEWVMDFRGGIEFARFSNNTVHFKGNAPNAFLYGDEAADADTIIIEGGSVTGTSSTSSYMLRAANFSAGDAYAIQNLHIKGVNIEGLGSIISYDTVNVKNFTFTNNRVKGGQIIDVHATDTSATSRYGKWLFKDNNFEDVTRVYDNNGFYHRISGWTWEGNNFDSSDYIFAYPLTVFDTIKILRNTIHDYGSYFLVRAFSAGGKVVGGHIIFDGNIVDCGIGVLEFASIGIGKTALFTNNTVYNFRPTQNRNFIEGAGTYKFINNNLFIDGGHIFAIDIEAGADATFVKNYIEYNDVSASTSLFRIADGSNLDLIDNTIYLVTAATHKVIDFVTGGTSTGIITGNYFDSNNAGITILDANDTGTLYLGVNTYKNVTTPLDTTGNTANITILSEFGN